MAKQLNVNLAFTADTGKAKAQLQDLQRQLDSLMKKSVTTTDGLGLTKDLMKATEAAGELKMMLEAATTPTGKLDLGTFNQAIQKSGRKLSEYAADLNSLGADGQKAFANIAKAISTAEMPLRRTNSLLSEFAVTLKNTARWQISSSILHGFMGSVQSAYGYVQDLNKSLNDIRIVTGQNTDQMAEFAANANKAAKALSTTTTAYTNAALIYYQQGDDDATVLEKTDITTKMANVTGQEAFVVSDQLTAIWNNFNKTGEESYEKYADILVALGAETASSTDEIAGGLEKFASIADMIGLSYEYAATALATITATTRQSEDVVGTALKTIFARIQGLNLGKTLDDGTTLNKYSEALEKVGISIFEQNGELKNMDSILDEMGSKWKTLSDDQQNALAQTVAGVRQYNQLVSLMDNWDYFGENLAIAEGAEGELDRQAETYAESWEAARKKVQAAAQSIYQTLIDDDFFIGLSNTFADLLSVIKGTIDGLGGLPGVLTLISSLMLQSFGPEIADSINNTFYNLTYNTQTARDELRKLREDAVSAMASLGDDSIAGSAAIDVFKEQSKLQDALLVKTHELEKAGKRLSDEETKRAQQLMDITDHIGQQILKAAELRQEEESITKTITDRITQESLGKIENLDEKIKNVKNLQTTYTALGPIISSCRDEMDKLGDSATEDQKTRMVELVKEAFKRLKESVDITGISFDGLSKESQELLSDLLGFENIDSFDVLKTKLGDMDDAVQGLGVDAQKAFISLRNELLKVDNIDKQGIKKLLDDLKTSLSTTGKLTAEHIQQIKNLGIAVDETGNIIEGFNGKILTFADGMVALGSVLSSFASVLLSIKGLSDIWTNEDLTTGEKVLRTLTTLGMILPMLTRLFDAENLAKLAALKIDKQQIKTTIIKIAGLNAETVANKGLTTVLWKKVAAYMAAHWWVLAIVAAMGIAVRVIVAITNAHNKEAKAAEMAAEKAANLKTAYNEASQAAQDLKDTINDYSSAIEQLDKLEKGTLEYKQALIEANEKAIELISKYKTLSNYTTRGQDGQIIIQQEGLDEILKEQLRTVEATQQQWIKAELKASQLREKSDLVNFSRDYKVKGQDNWEETSEQIVRTIAEYLEKYDLNELIEDDLNKLAIWGDLSQDVKNHITENIGAYEDMAESLNSTNSAQETLTEAYLDAAWRLNHPEQDDKEATPEGDRYSILNEALFATYGSKALSNAEQQKYINDYIEAEVASVKEDMGWTDLDWATVGSSVALQREQMLARGKGSHDDFDAYAKAMGWTWERDNSLKGEYFWNSMNPFSNGPTFAGQFYDQNGEKVGGLVDNTQILGLLSEKMASDDAAARANIETPKILASLDTLATALGPLGSSSFINLLASGQTIYDKDGNVESREFDLADAGMSQEEAQYIKDNWNTVTQAFVGYTDDIGFWTEMGFQSYNDYLDYAKQWIDERASQNDAEAYGLDRVNALQTVSNDVENRVLSGDLTSKNALNDESYNALVNGANQLAQMYPELIEEARMLANENLVGTEMWMEALHKVQEQVDQIKLDHLIAESDEIESEIREMFEGLGEDATTAEIEAVLMSDEFETKLDQLLDKNYEIDVEIHAQAEQAFESFSTAAEQMRTMASKIGESYVVAASDIRELNNVFPGIIQGMQDVGDGSVKLNEQVVQNAMNSANAEVQASAYSTIEQLENQASLLRSKQTTYMAMYEAALALSKGEGDAEANTQKIKEGMLEIEALNNQEMTDTKQENAEAVATDSNVQAGIMAQNWDSAYQSAAQSAIEFAKVAVSAAKSAQTGELQVVSGDFGVSYQGRNGQSSEAAKLAELQSAVNEASTTDDYAALAQSFLEAAESAGMKANDIEGMIAEIGAEYLDLSDLINGVGDSLGSGSKDTKALKDLAERYHEITREIQAQKHAIKELEKLKARAFGRDKLNYINQEIAAYKALEAEQLNLYNLRLADLKLDQQALQTQFNNKVQFDEDTHEITNFTELYNAGDEEQRKALEQYEQTLDALREQEIALEDIFDKLQDLNYEELTYRLELKLEINDAELKKLDYLLDKYSDNFYRIAESAALMNDKINPTIQKLEDYKNNKKTLDESYRNGEISQEAYIEGLKEIRDGYYENLEALIELDKQMMHYREDTLSAVAEEVAEFTDHMEHLTGVFDHYLSLMDILGKTKDYDAMGNFLSDKADTIRDRLDVAKEYYEMLKENNNIDKYWANYQDALAKGDADNAKWWKEQWDAEVDALDEAQEKMLGLTEEWTEAMKAVVENNMAEITDTLEKALTNGLGFDKLMDDFDKLNTRQEEYLTKTNQIYETNKLMRTANKALDETDNKVTKQKLKNFIDETKSLQENTQLSKYELEIQQAKYDLLLAEIALEEAQNAKSVVRLSRDSEGNFGYVYTADEDKVSDAQQKKEDAENRLYNISLDGQQEYTEKYLQAQQEFMDDLAELWDLYYNEGTISKEEYEKRVAQLEEHYYGPNGILTTYSKLYKVAVQTDANATADNWQTAYGEMTQDTDKWKKAVSDCYDQIDDQIITWEGIATQANEDVSDALSNSEEATKKLTDESAILAETIETEVLDAIEEEIDAVNIQTEAYENQRQTLLELIDTYEDYINQINKDIEEQSGYDKDIDYLALMRGYLAAGGTRGSDVWNELERQRKAKIKGENLEKKDYLYDTGDAEYDNLTGSTAVYKDEKAVREILRRLGISGFSSGGYTGEWGPSGKLAVLHEKEIVLNQDDTNNLLETVSLVRDLVSMIDAQAAIASLFNMPNMNHINSNNHQTLEQTVTIHAEFPNATQHSEIEEAFSNLVNIASQYANRKI